MNTFCTDGTIRTADGGIVGLWKGWNVKVDPDELAQPPVKIGLGNTRPPQRGKPTIESALRAIEQQRELERIRRDTLTRFYGALGALFDLPPAAEENT